MAVESSPSSPGRRRVTPLKLLVFLILIVVLGALVAWIWRGVQCNRALREEATRSAGHVALAIAVFGSPSVMQQDWGTLQSYADALVQERRLAHIAIVDGKGRAVVHTNRSLLRQPFAQTKERGVIEESAPVMSLTKQVATVWVGVKPRRL